MTGGRGENSWDVYHTHIQSFACCSFVLVLAFVSWENVEVRVVEGQTGSTISLILPAWAGNDGGEGGEQLGCLSHTHTIVCLLFFRSGSCFRFLGECRSTCGRRANWKHNL